MDVRGQAHHPPPSARPQLHPTLPVGKGATHRIVHRYKDTQVCLLPHLPTKVHTLLRGPTRKPGLSGPHASMFAQQGRHGHVLVHIQELGHTYTCWKPQAGLLTHTTTQTHSYACKKPRPPPPAPLPLPRPHLALPQRLLLHGWYDLCLNVHIQVKLQGEALLAWVLKGRGSQLLHPWSLTLPRTRVQDGNPSMGVSPGISPACPGPKEAPRVPLARGRSCCSISHPAQVGSTGLQGRLARAGPTRSWPRSWSWS